MSTPETNRVHHAMQNVSGKVHTYIGLQGKPPKTDITTITRIKASLVLLIEKETKQKRRQVI